MRSTHRLTQQPAFVRRVLAVEMATGGGGSRAPHVAAKVLSSSLNQDSIIAIMAALAATCREASTVSDDDVPAASLLANWKAADLPPGDNEYTYTLTEFSMQLSPMQSPKFEAAGYKWRLRVRLEHDNAGLFLLPSTPMWFPVAYTLELVNQVGAFSCLSCCSFMWLAGVAVQLLCAPS
jgi:hypothetical protein